MKKIIFAFSLIMAFATSVVHAEAPRGFCTADVNVWGNASICSCDVDGLVYSEVTGTCMTQAIFNSLGRQGDRPEGICTSDIRAYGNPSACNCPEGNSYDMKSGACLSQVAPKIVSVLGKLELSGDAEDILSLIHI